MPRKPAPSATFESAQKKLWTAEIRTLSAHLTRQQRQTAAAKKALRKQIAAHEKAAAAIARKIATIEKREPTAAAKITRRINQLRARISA